MGCCPRELAAVALVVVTCWPLLRLFHDSRGGGGGGQHRAAPRLACLHDDDGCRVAGEVVTMAIACSDESEMAQ